MASNMSLSDSDTSKETLMALNCSFDSIKLMVDEYTPKTTNQDYGLLLYYGPIKEGDKVYVTKPCEGAIPIYCQYYSTYRYVGTLAGNTVEFVTTVGEVEEGKELKKFLIYQPYRARVDSDPHGLKTTKSNYTLEDL